MNSRVASIITFDWPGHDLEGGRDSLTTVGEMP